MAKRLKFQTVQDLVDHLNDDLSAHPTLKEADLRPLTRTMVTGTTSDSRTQRRVLGPDDRVRILGFRREESRNDILVIFNHKDIACLLKLNDFISRLSEASRGVVCEFLDEFAEKNGYGKRNDPADSSLFYIMLGKTKGAQRRAANKGPSGAVVEDSKTEERPEPVKVYVEPAKALTNPAYGAW